MSKITKIRIFNSNDRLNKARVNAFYNGINLIGASLWTGDLMDIELFSSDKEEIQKFIDDNDLGTSALEDIEIPHQLNQ